MRVARLLADRSEWLVRHPSGPNDRAERFRRLRHINDELRPLIDGRPRLFAERLNTCERQVTANAILRRRDYAFCLYPEHQLKPFLSAFL
jgi:hypothetical protein